MRFVAVRSGGGGVTLFKLPSADSLIRDPRLQVRDPRSEIRDPRGPRSEHIIKAVAIPTMRQREKEREKERAGRERERKFQTEDLLDSPNPVSG